MSERDPKLDSPEPWVQNLAWRRAELLRERESTQNRLISSLAIAGRIDPEAVKRAIAVRDELALLAHIEKLIAERVVKGEDLW